MTNRNMRIAQAFAYVLRDLRQAAGLSQERLAELAGLDRTFISLLERGRRQPSLLTLHQLAEVFGMSLADIARKIDERLNRSNSTP